MKLKSLLLGSAAALLTVGAAQAADFGAEPVNYVRVCDAFGPGFYYAPGTDTCIKISGWVRMDINIGTQPYVGVTISQASHAFAMYNQLQVTAASMTEYGPLIGYLALENGIGGWNGPPPTTGIGQFVTFDAATLQLGPFSAGYAWSSFSNNIFSTYHNAQFAPLGGNHTIFMQLSWAWEGVGLFIAAEDYRTRDGGTGGGNPSTGQVPDIVGGVTFSAAGVNAKVSAGWGDRWGVDTWGVHGELGFGLGQLGNLSVQANYSANADDWACWAVTTCAGNLGNFTGVYAGLSTPWTSQLSSLIAGVWYNGPGTTFDYSQIIGQLNFRPVNNFLVGAEVQHTWMPGGLSNTTAIIRTQRSFP
jgi:hypothetical protein